MDGMKQLFKGVFIGVVLILAIIGSMSIMDTKDDSTQSPPVQANNAPNPPITADQTAIVPPQSTNTTPNVSENVAETTKPTIVENTAEEPVPSKPEEPQVKAPQYGTLQLASVDFETDEKLKASYQVFNSNDEKVAENKNTENTSIRLPVGQYKVISTLSPLEGSTRKTEPVESTQFITVRADRVTQKLFKMEPPLTIGILQVSAKNAETDQIMRADFLIQKENGETVSSRKGVTNTLFKLNAGSYKVTVNSGENTDFRTVVVEPGQSTKAIFKLKKSYLQGKLMVRIFDTFSPKPVLADIKIISANGKVVQELTAVFKTEISLLAGNYTIRVTGPSGQSSKNITITGGQAISEVFRFDAPAGDQNSPQISESVDGAVPQNIDPNQINKTNSEDQTSTIPTEENTTDAATSTTTGTLRLFARNDINQAPIKSNFYVQTPSGKHIIKKTYAESAEFTLDPGAYKITVRAKDRKNLVKTIQVTAGQNISEVFSLLGLNQQHSVAPKLGGLKPAKPVKNNTLSAGFLSIVMQPAKKTHFIVSTHAGKKVVELTSVTRGDFKLDTGAYEVSAVLNGQRKSKAIQIRAGQTSNLRFNAANFTARKSSPPPRQNATQKTGILRSSIVDQLGRALKANLTVTDSQGKIVARANNVSVGIFKLPPVPHTINIDFQGLRGSERVNVISGETTVQTFTVAP